MESSINVNLEPIICRMEDYPGYQVLIRDHIGDSDDFIKGVTSILLQGKDLPGYNGFELWNPHPGCAAWRFANGSVLTYAKPDDPEHIAGFQAHWIIVLIDHKGVASKTMTAAYIMRLRATAPHVEGEEDKKYPYTLTYEIER